MWKICTFVVFTLLAAGCSSHRTAAPARPLLPVYTSGFPQADATAALERISKSVRKVYSVSSYTTYQFRRESKITWYDLQRESFKREAWGVISTNETIFGSATVIGFNSSRVALLTCAHVVTAPDTLVGYFEPTASDQSRYIRSLSIREKQENWIRDLSSCGSFEVLAADNASDIAIIGKRCDALTDSVYLFPYPRGVAKELGWGSFLYMFGYPLGSEVITTGIASPAPKRPFGEFSVDALLNKGFSGGILLALRGGVPNFEMAGMIKTVSSNREEFLKPATDQQHMPDRIPYQGDLFVGRTDNIQYGLNSVVPMEQILAFYTAHRDELITAGYNLDAFFKP